MNLVIDTYPVKSYPLILEEIIDLTTNIDDRLSQNYGDNLDFVDSLAVTVVKDDETLVAFSTILHREMFGNSVRILNRHFKNPKYRRMNWGHQRRIREYTYEMIQQQILYAKDGGFDVAFISRELKENNLDKLNSTALNRFKNYFPDHQKWILSPKMHLVVMPKRFKQNWQSILYYKLNKDGKLRTPSLSVEAYKERFYYVN